MSNVYRGNGGRMGGGVLEDYRFGSCPSAQPDLRPGLLTRARRWPGDTLNRPPLELGSLGCSVSAEVLANLIRSIADEYRRKPVRNWFYETQISFAPEPEQDLIPGAEYPATVAYTPKPRFRLRGKIRSIRRGHVDFALSDEEWRALGLEDVSDDG